MRGVGVSRPEPRLHREKGSRPRQALGAQRGEPGGAAAVSGMGTVTNSPFCPIHCPRGDGRSP